MSNRQYLKTNSVIRRYHRNPILSSKDIPYESSLTFNAGVVKFNGKYVMIFRNDVVDNKWNCLETNLGLAFSDDGLSWEVTESPCFSLKTDEILRAYDPRLTVIENRCYMCFAVDTRHGLRGGIAVTDDFHDFEILSLSAPDNRNMVLFPEKVNGSFVRFERPFSHYDLPGVRPVSDFSVQPFDMWLSTSPDCRHWGNTQLVLGREQVPYSNTKIGPGAPPIKTDKGWLTIFHAVAINKKQPTRSWRGTWFKTYYAGIMLLDLENPSKVIGMSREPLMVPETNYELEGLVGSVIFPGGMILEDNDEVKIYYGAADTVEALATARLNDLIDLCKPI